MKMKELVVRLENRFMNYFEVVKEFKAIGIVPWSYTIDNDGAGFGSLRIIVPFIEAARQKLMEMHETVKCDINEVVLIEDSNVFDRLADAEDKMIEANLVIKRLYQYQGQGDATTMVFEFNDNDKAIEVLRIENRKIGYTRPRLLEQAA